jgi:SPP1 gp7 family putative phage head morphogenesis protein
MLVEGWLSEYETGIQYADVSRLQSQLRKYADVLEPWARSTVMKVGAELALKERASWAKHANLMAASMRRELESAPTGVELQRFMREQVKLIRSLPTEAGERVGKLVLESLSSGRRANEIVQDILRTGEVTKSRANNIARTEVSTASTNLTRVRSESIGSEEYIWRTSRDSDVRLAHRKMEGKVCRWDTPPLLSDGTRTHAGCIYNCRCWPEPIIPGIRYQS